MLLVLALLGAAWEVGSEEGADPECRRCGSCARCVVAPRRADQAGGRFPAEYTLHERGGRPERLPREQCVLRGLCAYSSQHRLVEQYGAHTACMPPADNGTTCCAATQGTWFPYMWVPQGRPCIQDCAKVWGGNATVDKCGVCGGDGSACVVGASGDGSKQDDEAGRRLESPAPSILSAAVPSNHQ
eukprot:COSAG02_NODE_20864_length_813_cov_0.719888_2_plen_185_part_01